MNAITIQPTSETPAASAGPGCSTAKAVYIMRMDAAKSNPEDHHQHSALPLMLWAESDKDHGFLADQISNENVKQYPTTKEATQQQEQVNERMVPRQFPLESQFIDRGVALDAAPRQEYALAHNQGLAGSPHSTKLVVGIPAFRAPPLGRQSAQPIAAIETMGNRLVRFSSFGNGQLSHCAMLTAYCLLLTAVRR